MLTLTRRTVIEIHRPPRRPWPAVLPVVLVLLLLAAGAGAGPEQDAAPDARAHHQLVHHAGEQRTYLVGGSTRRDDGYHYFDDVWAWGGTEWIRAPSFPFPRSSHRVVHHAARDSLVLFGGGFAGAVRTEGVLWERTDGGWKAVGGELEAGATETGMCYDARRERVVIFGGWDADNAFRPDTWEWDGEALSRVDDGAGRVPAPRAGHAVVFDPVRQRCLLFGGRGEEGYLADTWLWDGAAWQRLDAPGPSPRWFFGAAADPDGDRVVVFGGRGPDATAVGRDATGDLGDTWVWDGREWERLDTEGPPARSGAQMARTGRGVLLFGGRVERAEGFVDRNDTWELRGRSWIQRR